MHHSHVSIQILRLPKIQWTEVTAIPRVQFSMCLHISFLVETLLTDTAFKGLSIRIDMNISNMGFEISFAGERFIAIGTNKII